MTSEEDIIKKRLLIEGDSGNEDRLINKLAKNFVKWTNSIIVNNEINATTNINNTQLDEENVDYLYEQMIASLSNAEFGLLRNHFMYILSDKFLIFLIFNIY
jgi:THO complex subunit 7